MSIWDQINKTNGEYVKFETPGDSVAGTIIDLGLHTFEDGKKVVKLTIRTDTGETTTLTAGQVQLAAKLGEVRPEVGDHLTVIYVRSEKRAGGKTLKHFDVKVVRGESGDLI